MTQLDIDQAKASGQAKLNAEAYSGYLKQVYGLANYCGKAPVNCLLLFLWALGAWDNRPGGYNPYTEQGIKIVITKINDI